MGCAQSKDPVRGNPDTGAPLESTDIDLEFKELWDKPRTERDAWKAKLDELTSLDIPYAERPESVYDKAVLGKLLQESELTRLGVKRPALRLFLSSTFTDTELERNVLIEDVHPYLRLVGQKLNVQVHQSSEMRWGIRAEASASHQTTEICLEEIARCQRDSSGLSYALILGNKYGFRPFPARIPETEYQRLTERIAELSVTHKEESAKRLKKAKGSRLSMSTTSPEQAEEIKLAEEDASDNPYEKALVYMQQWFTLDENIVPPSRVLKAVGPNEADQWWGSVFPSIQRSLRDASAVIDDKNRRRLYTQSVTQDEIYNGLLQLNAQQRANSCVVFDRTFDDIDVMSKEARFFIDMGKRDVDADAQGNLDSLRKTEIPTALQGMKDNVFKYNIAWDKSGGISIANAQHAEYLRKFADDFCAVLTDSIVQIAKENRFEPDDLIEEVASQALFRTRRCATFVDNPTVSALVSKVMGYVDKRLTDTSSQPQAFGVCGASGSGKTSLMAFASEQLSKKYAESNEAVVVTRFLGTSKLSSSARSVMVSIIEQLSKGADVPPIDAASLPFDRLVLAFARTLKAAGKKKKVIIVLDSLDQLSDANSGRRLTWLPIGALPENVALVVSSLPEVGGCWNVLQGALGAENTAHVQPFNASDARNILMTFLNARNRTITQAQQDVLLAAFSKCPTPLYLLTCAEFFASKWSHTEQVDPSFFPEDIAALIDKVFEQIETQNGANVVRAALTYLTAARGGLSDTEMDDILSLNDDVLDDIFEWWVPPVRRVPPLIWTRIHSALSSAIIEKGAEGGISVRGWYHRQYWEAAERRYLGDFEVVTRAHIDIANYFAGVYEEGKPITRTAAGKAGSDGRGSKDGEMHDRKVQRMPFAIKGAIFSAAEDCIVNVRKVAALPYHLTKARMWQECGALLTNLEFIQAKAIAKLVPDLLQDYSLFLNDCPADVVGEYDVNTWSAFVSSNSFEFTRSPYGVVARATVLPDTATVYKAAMDAIARWKGCLPVTRMYQKPCRPEVRHMVLKNLGGNVTSIAFTRDGKYIWGGTEKGKIVVFDALRSDVVFKLIPPNCRNNRFPPSVSNLVALPNGKEMLSTSKNVGVFWDIASGEVVRDFPLIREDTYIRKLALTSDERFFLVAYTVNSDNTKVAVFDGDFKEELSSITVTEQGCTFSEHGGIVVVSTKTTVAWYELSGEGELAKLKDVETTKALDGSYVKAVIFKRPEEKGSKDITLVGSKKVLDIAFDSGEMTASAPINSLAFSGIKGCDDKYIFVGDFDEALEVFDAQTLEYKMTMKGTMTGTIAKSPDSYLIASGGTNFSDITVFNSRLIEPSLAMPPDPEPWRFYFTPTVGVMNDKRVFTVSGASNKVLVLDAATFETVKEYDLGDGASARQAYISANGKHIITGLRKGCTTAIIDTDTDKIHHDVFKHGTEPQTTVEISPALDVAVVCNAYGSFAIIDLATRNVLASMDDENNRKNAQGFHKHAITVVQFHPDFPKQPHILTCSDDSTAKLWDGTNGKLVRTFKEHEGNVTGGAFMGAGFDMVATVDDEDDPNHNLYFSKISDPDFLVHQKLPVDYPNSNVQNQIKLLWSTHLDLLISCGTDQKVKFWNDKGELVRQVASKISSLAPIPSIPRLVFKHAFGGAALIDVETWKVVLHVLGHDSTTGGGSFSVSPDGHFVVSRGSDKRIISNDVSEILRGRRGSLTSFVRG